MYDPLEIRCRVLFWSMAVALPLVSALILLCFVDSYSAWLTAVALAIAFIPLVGMSVKLYMHAAKDNNLNSTSDVGGVLRYHSDGYFGWVTKSTAIAIGSELLNFAQLASLAVIPSLFPAEAHTDILFTVAFIDLEVEYDAYIYLSIYIYI